jgi:hypothetical protein
MWRSGRELRRWCGLLNFMDDQISSVVVPSVPLTPVPYLHECRGKPLVRLQLVDIPNALMVAATETFAVEIARHSGH